MSAGTEMDGMTVDELLAVRLFGWRRESMHMVYNDQLMYRWYGPDGRLLVTHPCLQGWDTSGDGMLRVVEKMREKGWMYVHIEYLQHDANSWGWCVMFENETEEGGERYDKTAPMAATLAALSALGVDYGGR